MDSYVHAGVHECVGQRLTLSVILSRSLPPVFEIVSLLHLDLGGSAVAAG